MKENNKKRHQKKRKITKLKAKKKMWCLAVVCEVALER
jgi:hypothetical protein